MLENCTSKRRAATEFIRHCSGDLLEFVSGVRPAFYVLDDNLKPVYCEPLRDTPASAASAYLHRFWRSDPLLPGGFCQTPIAIRTLSGFTKHETSMIDGEFDNFVRSEGCIDALKVDLWLGNQIVGGFAIGRDVSDGPFTINDIQTLERCSRLIEHAAAYGDGHKRVSLVLDILNLTRREIEIVELVSKGHTNSAIALKCGISLATVKTHLINIFLKTGVRNRAELVATLT